MPLSILAKEVTNLLFAGFCGSVLRGTWLALLLGALLPAPVVGQSAPSRPAKAARPAKPAPAARPAEALPASPAPPPATPPVWQPDLGNGTYQNPVLHADYPAPDVLRVGADYYLVAASYGSTPGLPILHSRDLVSWTPVGAALPELPAAFRLPQPGNGVGAPALRYHNQQFYLYYADPDRGIYVTRARQPAGPWDAPQLVKEAKGWTDPCPFWDDDGRAYLVHAFAGSRAGLQSVLALSPLSADGLRLTGPDALLFDGHPAHPGIAGPKLYKRRGFYYVFAPAGSGAAGWQTVLRARSVYGPYEARVVLAQGKTAVEGPRQGAWVDAPDGKDDWFVHGQDRGPYGRVVHLQPLSWQNDWPVVGEDPDGDGCGQPLLRYRKPRGAGPGPAAPGPPASDEFDGLALGPQWQWPANPPAGAALPNGPQGYLRLYAQPLPADFKNYSQLPGLLLQPLPAESFTATAKLTFVPRAEGEQVGLLVLGLDYAYVSVRRERNIWRLSQSTCRDAHQLTLETSTVPLALKPPASGVLYLRVQVRPGARCRFSYSLDGAQFEELGEEFQAREGQGIGARLGLLCSSPGRSADAGNADVDWWRITP